MGSYCSKREGKDEETPEGAGDPQVSFEGIERYFFRHIQGGKKDSDGSLPADLL